MSDISTTHQPPAIWHWITQLSPLGKMYQPRTKRLGDLILCLLILPVLIPVITVMYILVRLDGGAGFYGHTRIGRNGVPFKCWKIRTMSVDADTQLAKLLHDDPAARAAWEKDRKLRHDPRITCFGKFFRQSSLDELPQIWNVLRGDMSLVGPRPVTKSELIKYGEDKTAYLSIRPGITGLWQVSGRNDVTYSERVALDVAYQKNLSWLFDTQILLKTVLVVLSRSGM